MKHIVLKTTDVEGGIEVVFLEGNCRYHPTELQVGAHILIEDLPMIVKQGFSVTLLNTQDEGSLNSSPLRQNWK